MPETLTVQPNDVHNQFLVSNVHPPDWANPEPAGSVHRVARNPSGKTRTRLLEVLLHPRHAKEVTVLEAKK